MPHSSPAMETRLRSQLIQPAQPPRHRSGGAGAAERVEHEVVGTRRRQDHTRQQGLRLLRRVQLAPVAALEPLLAGTERDQPIGAHLDVVVARLQRFVVERVVPLGGVADGPDQGLVRIGEAPAAKIRHRVRLAPDDIVEDPEAEVLHQRADTEDVVVGADDPERRVRLHGAAAGGEPGAGEIVIGRKA